MKPIKLLKPVVMSVTALFLLATAAGFFGIEHTSDGWGQRVQINTVVDVDQNAEPIAPQSSIKELQVVTVLTELDTVDNLLIAAWRLPWMLVAGLIIFFMWRIIRSVADGDPFRMANVWRLRWIAAVLVVSPFVKLLAGIARDALIERSVAAELAYQHVQLAFWPMLVGVAAFVISEVFATGLRMRKDVEGLV